MDLISTAPTHYAIPVDVLVDLRSTILPLLIRQLLYTVYVLVDLRSTNNAPAQCSLGNCCSVDVLVDLRSTNNTPAH